MGFYRQEFSCRLPFPSANYPRATNKNQWKFYSRLGSFSKFRITHLRSVCQRRCQTTTSESSSLLRDVVEISMSSSHLNFQRYFSLLGNPLAFNFILQNENPMSWVKGQQTTQSISTKNKKHEIRNSIQGILSLSLPFKSAAIPFSSWWVKLCLKKVILTCYLWWLCGSFSKMPLIRNTHTHTE